MTVSLNVSRAAAERACAEAVCAQALGVTVHSIRATGEGTCIVGRWRGATGAQEAVIASAGAAWAGEETAGDPRAIEAAKFILGDAGRRATVLKIAAIVAERGIA